MQTNPNAELLKFRNMGCLYVGIKSKVYDDTKTEGLTPVEALIILI